MPSMSPVTRIWPSQATPAPIPMVTAATALVISAPSTSVTPSTTIAKAPASSVARASASTRARSRSSRPFALEPALDVHGLRAQADMADGGDAPSDQERDRVGDALTRLSLDGLASSLLQEARCAVVSPDRAGLVRAEGEVDGHEGARRPPHD